MLSMDWEVQDKSMLTQAMPRIPHYTLLSLLLVSLPAQLSMPSASGLRCHSEVLDTVCTSAHIFATITPIILATLFSLVSCLGPVQGFFGPHKAPL